MTQACGRRGRWWDPTVLVLVANEPAGGYGQDEDGGRIHLALCTNELEGGTRGSPPSLSCPVTFMFVFWWSGVGMVMVAFAAWSVDWLFLIVAYGVVGM